MMLSTIHCRAQVSDSCYDGRPCSSLGEDYHPADDGTFHRDSNTIICDACYILLMPLTPSGKALHHELDEAIERVRVHRETST